MQRWNFAGAESPLYASGVVLQHAAERKASLSASCRPGKGGGAPTLSAARSLKYDYTSIAASPVCLIKDILPEVAAPKFRMSDRRVVLPQYPSARTSMQFKRADQPQLQYTLLYAALMSEANAAWPPSLSYQS